VRAASPPFARLNWGCTVGIIESLALALGASFLSGFNLYGVAFVLGALQISGLTELPAGLQILSSPYVLTAAGALYIVEFFADKIPGFDSLWDVLHTFIRIPGGSLLAVAALEGVTLADGLVRYLASVPDTPPIEDIRGWEPRYVRASNAERLWTR